MGARNVYQMYVDNGCQVGFWLRRWSWWNVVLQVKFIDGGTCGELAGVPPYFGNPIVLADVYRFGRYVGLCQVRCPGSYAYRLVDPESKASIGGRVIVEVAGIARRRAG
jgi:hypothetical protein